MSPKAMSECQLRLTAGGDPNSSVNATINLPLIPDTLALRATIFDDHRGGYISNVPGTIQVPDAGNYYPIVPAPMTCAPTALPAITACRRTTSSGSAIDISTRSTYGGARASLLWKINDDWNALVQQNFQNMEADG
jgi:iron complex outermembrane receptor protein